MGKQPWNDLFPSVYGNQVAATNVTPTSPHAIHPETEEVYIITEEEDQNNPAPLVSKKDFD